jgi:hypothetical protein
MWVEECFRGPETISYSIFSSSLLAADPSSTVISGQVIFFGVSIFINCSGFLFKKVHNTVVLASNSKLKDLKHWNVNIKQKVT